MTPWRTVVWLLLLTVLAAVVWAKVDDTEQRRHQMGEEQIDARAVSDGRLGIKDERVLKVCESFRAMYLCPKSGARRRTPTVRCPSATTRPSLSPTSLRS